MTVSPRPAQLPASRPARPGTLIGSVHALLAGCGWWLIIPSGHRPGRAEQTGPRGSRSFSQWGTPP